jgi:tetratricopeptide (TPR) repeat protein
LAVVGVWWARPWLHVPRHHHWEENVDAARRALETVPPNTAVALALGEELLDQIDRIPHRAAEVHYLVGSAFLHRAEEASKEQAVYAWRKARHHLEQAAAGEVPEKDRGHLRYRLAYAWYHTGAEPQQVLEALRSSIEAADDPVEGYGILTQVYLHLPHPDYKAALEANGQQLALPTSDERLLDQARLVRGEILLHLKQGEEARKVLARIQPASPAFARARLLRARSCQQDRLWAEAAVSWEQILKDSATPLPETKRVLYFLGFCYRRLDRSRDAIRTWERIYEDDGEIGQAAALGLAELRLLGSNPGSALEYFERALGKINADSPYRNSLLDGTEARNLVERGCRACLKVADFEHAQKLAELEDKLAHEVNRELLAEVAESWARDCSSRAAKLKGAKAKTLQKQAETHFREAAAAFQALTEAGREQAEQVQWLWRSADCYLQGRQHLQAAATLQRFLGIATDPQRLGEGWFTLAETYRTLEDDTAARAAFRKCIEYPSPFAFRARYQLAMGDIEQARNDHDQAKLEDSERALQHNLDLMRFAPDHEAYEKTLIALADLAIGRGHFRLASVRLHEVIDRYPGSSQSLRIRKQLADCYRRLAAQEDQNTRSGSLLSPEAERRYRDQGGLWLQKAAAHYQKLADDLTAKDSTARLTDEESAVLQQALTGAAECHFFQRHFPQAIGFFEKIAARYPRQGESLKALQMITVCYWSQKNQAQARETIQRIRKALQELPDDAFTSQPALPTRRDWERWVEWAWQQG